MNPLDWLYGTLHSVESMYMMDACSFLLYFCTCNWDDGRNSIAQQYLVQNYAFLIRLGKGDAQGDGI
jgi:hypothetical protein